MNDCMQKYLKLNNGVIIPRLGIGTDNACAESLVINAVNSGIRLIDTSYMYLTETVVGQAIQKLIETGEIKRTDLFIQTKTPHIKAGYFSTLKEFENCEQ